jgi:uncharacterized protein (DUF1800 family)
VSLMQAAIAANRFGLGAKPDELNRISGDPRGALRAQLDGGAPLVREALPASDELLAQAFAMRGERREAKGTQPSPRLPAMEPAAGETAARPDVVAIAQTLRSVYVPAYVADISARTRQGITSDRSFVERLVQFWSNHFAVSVDKLQVLGLAGPMEREAIRPHVLGRFGDLLLAVEQHPAMLLYLDNAQSVGPDSRAAQFLGQSGRNPSGRKLGLNENLAREILELHTLGVEGGYSQKDVQALAAIISGWSISGARGLPNGRLAQRLAGTGEEPGHFQFREALHQPGTQQLLGRAYAQEGLAQGEAALADLAQHSATARHLATKLARHFIADDPPAAAVDRIAKVYLHTGGDLPSVYRALIDSPEAWQTQFTKFRVPSDYLFATWRALDLPVGEGRAAIAPFELLGQRCFQPGSPAGWPDRSADWDASSALMKRLEWAQQMGQRLGAQRSASELAIASWGAAPDSATLRSIARAQDPAQGLVLWLGAPEFMRR